MIVAIDLDVRDYSRVGLIPACELHMKLISIVLPVYCEEASLPLLFTRLREIFVDGSSDSTYEFVFINDGSTDASLSMLTDFASREPRARVATFSRNFGHQSALLAGLTIAKGDAVVLMDADLQDPPELVHDMIEKWRGGADIVHAQRRERHGEHFLKRMTAALFYRLLDYLSDTTLPRNVGDFRLMDRIVVDQLVAMNEKSIYLRGMSAWLGFTQDVVIFDRDPRVAGTTKYSARKMLGLAGDAILSFSEKPLRLVTRLGLVVTFLSFLWGTYLFLATLFTNHRNLSGWPSLILSILFLGGVQLICLGIVGEYVSRIYREAKGRPLYIIDQRKSIR